MHEIQVLQGSDEYEFIQKDYITLRSFASIVNRSDVWVKRRFMAYKGRPVGKYDNLKVNIMAPFVNDEGETVIGRKNVYIYLKRSMIEDYFLSGDIYKAEPKITDPFYYEYKHYALRMHISNFKIENLIPRSNNSKKGGIKWSTAVKNNYLVIFPKDGGVFFYKDE